MMIPIREEANSNNSKNFQIYPNNNLCLAKMITDQILTQMLNLQHHLNLKFKEKELEKTTNNNNNSKNNNNSSFNRVKAMIAFGRGFPSNGINKLSCLITN